jgi:large repetitive protein
LIIPLQTKYVAIAINNTTFFASGTFSNLAAGSYTITVKDANGCRNTKQVTISNISFTPTFTTNYVGTTCGNSTGTINATPNGGTAPHQYSINNGTSYQASNIFAGLGAGQYFLKIKDANGCLSTTITVDITPSFGVGISAVSTNSTCGNTNGILTATAIGGAAPFQYSINGGTTYQASNIFNGLLANTYTVKIKDANGCVNNTLPIVVTNTAGAIITAVPTNSTCGNANGIITATPNGGTAAFQYSINAGVSYQASNIFNGLLANTYTITIKDANGCVNNTAAIVVANTAGATVTAVSQNSTCGNANGIITAMSNGGTAPFQYSINAGITYQASNIFNGLLANTYTITIKDANGCLNNSIPYVVANTTGATVTAVSQNSTCGNANGIITATANGGSAPFQYSINAVSFQTSNIITALLANTYIVTIKDANGCLNNTVPIIVANTAGAIVTAISQNSSCGNSNGKITATAQGGTLPYLYSIDAGITYQSTPTFNNLAGIPYIVSVKDANNCINTFNITVGVTPIPVLNVFAGNDTSVVINQPLRLNAIDVNSIGFVSYAWSPSFGLNRTDVNNPTAILDRDFAYEVKATTADGCVATDSIKIKITFLSNIFVPTAFTPNGDGKNDVLRPRLIGIKQLNYFSVYNRYGELIFTSNNESLGWNGLVKGKEQNTGSFVWIAEGVDYLGRTVVRQGSSILVR